MPPIRFGTEGWRAVIADQYTFHNVRAVARATARWFQREGLHRAVAVGHDTRFLGDRFARATADELAAADLEVQLTAGPLPTPALCYHVVKQGLAGGVMLTASHNPAEYNGFKVKRKEGCSIFEDEAKWIEREANEILDQEGPPVWAPAREHTRFDVHEEYVGGLLAQIDTQAIRKAKLTVVADMMHGAGGGFFDRALRGAGCAEVRAVRADPSPTFDWHHPEPLGPNLAESVLMTADAAVDIGVATDGDADRFGLMAHGEYLDVMRAIVYVLYHLLKNRGWKGRVVRSVNVTTMLDRLCQHYGVEVIETPVGFKNIAPHMLEHPDEVLLGVEESGGFGIRGHIPDRDGTFTALTACECRAVEGKPVRDTLNDIGAIIGGLRAYDRLDLTLTPAQRDRLAVELGRLNPYKIAGRPVTQVNRLDGVKLIRDDGTWLLLRLSGTEPLIRVYAEGMNPQEVQVLLESGRRIVEGAEGG